MPNFDGMPNLFVIGAAKAGTTALYSYLAQHPQVFLSRIKEPEFFSQEQYYARGLDWYKDWHFEGAEDYPVKAEATPHYLYWSEKVAPRIKEAYRERPVKFIATFRDPVSRAYSMYWNMVGEGIEDLDFDEALRVEERRLEQNRNELYQVGSMAYGYSTGSRYASLLQPYLDLFSPENFFFVFQDDLKSRANETCKEIFEFLGIESSIEISPSKSNPAAMPRSKLLHKALRRRPLFNEFIRPFIPIRVRRLRRSLKSKIVKANLKETPYGPLHTQLARELRLSYTSEIEKLEKITGRELSSWKAE